MMKKTIEQLLKPVILADIQSLLTQAGADGDLYTLKLTNDLKVQEKNETRFTIPAIIKTGQGTRSNIPGINALQSSIMIIFQMDANYIQEFLTIINTYCSLTNAYKSTVVDDLSDDDTETSITYEYRFSWSLATPTGTPFDVSVAVTGEQGVNSETIQMEQVILTGSVYYSDVLKLEDEELYLYLQTGTTSVQNWVEDDWEFVWNTSDPDMRAYVLIYGTEIPWESWDPEDYPANYCLKFEFDSNPGVYIYYLNIATETPVYGYVKVEGIQDFEDSVTPMLTTTSLVDQYQPEYDVTGDTFNGTYNLIRIPGNTVHDYLVGLMHTTRTSASFDVTIKAVINSLSITETGIEAILSNLKKRKIDGFEYISFSLTRR